MLVNNSTVNTLTLPTPDPGALFNSGLTSLLHMASWVFSCVSRPDLLVHIQFSIPSVETRPNLAADCFVVSMSIAHECMGWKSWDKMEGIRGRAFIEVRGMSSDMHPTVVLPSSVDSTTETLVMILSNSVPSFWTFSEIDAGREYDRRRTQFTRASGTDGRCWPHEQKENINILIHSLCA